MELRPKGMFPVEAPSLVVRKQTPQHLGVKRRCWGLERSIDGPKVGMLATEEAHPALRRGVDEGLLILSVVRVVGPCG